MLCKPIEEPHLWPAGLVRVRITVDDPAATKGYRHVYASVHIRSRCNGYDYLAWGDHGSIAGAYTLDGIRSSVGLVALKADICAAIRKQTGCDATPAPLTAAQRDQLDKDFPVEDR